MTDPISDMLNRIMNAQAVLHESVVFSYSNLKYEVGLILQKEGFIKSIERKGRKEKRIIKIDLKYSKQNGKNYPAISKVKRISKPGQRIYSPAQDLKAVKGGYGISIISTPKGLLINKEARKQNVGGEILCEIW
ncbi:MAG: 30S ribosomal protein S8 [bacterium]|nr:30S ribosomal protein S8 [bacterium]